MTIHSRDIFSDGEVASAREPVKFLRRAMNGVHATTKHYVLRRELLFREGDAFEPALLAETERNLRNLGFLNDIHVTAVDTTADGRVNVLVSTRESWSLRTTLAYTRSSGGEQRWKVQLSDRNFLGYGVTVGAGIGADEDRSFWNVWYRKRRLFRKALWLGIDYSERRDGHYKNIQLSRPYFAQDDPWGLDARAWDDRADRRYYLSNAGPAGLDPAAESSLYAWLPLRVQGALLQASLRASRREAGRIWRTGVGARITETDYALGSVDELSDGRQEDLSWLAGPGQPLSREEGVRVFPYLWVHSEGRRWTKARFVRQYGPVEDLALDFQFDLRVGPAGGVVGSTTGWGETSLRGEIVASKWTPAGPGMLLTQLVAEGQTGSRDVRNHRLAAVAGWVAPVGDENSPWITRAFVEAGNGSRLVGNQALTLGLDQGLRTLDFDGMAGDRLLRWNLEQGKASPLELVGLARFGGAVFYGGGLARWGDEQRSLADARHEVGFGLRVGPTRSANSQVARFDLSWNLDGSRGPVFTAVTRGLF